MKKLLLLLFLLLIPIVTADDGHIKLLAVAKEGGSVADLYVDIKPGANRIFMEVYPFAQLDTQISTRFAKEIACKFLEKDCSHLDFIYTLRAHSTLVGGPSAGAATAMLTVAVLADLPIDESVTVTGTINSGGLVGPVGGIKEKIESAAQDPSIKTVLLPSGARYETNHTSNETVDLLDYGRQQGLNMIEISTLAQGVYHLTGKNFSKPPQQISDEQYNSIMINISKSLCNRADSLRLKAINKTLPLTNASYKLAKNITQNSQTALNNSQYYSAASYCFGAGIHNRYIDLVHKNLSTKQKLANYKKFTQERIKLESSVDNRPIQTIPDLQTYMILKERLAEAQDRLELFNKSINITESLFHLSFAIERLNTVKSWSAFFRMEGQQFTFDSENFANACAKKISEAEERYQYVGLYFPFLNTKAKDLLDRARDDYRNHNYKLCLFRASKAQAESDTILSTIGVEDEQVEQLALQKLDVAQNVISEEIQKDRFPILGYSYYQYANSLLDSDKYSAIIYAEYALELSNLDMYFPKKPSLSININPLFLIIFIAGIYVGMLIENFVKRKLR